MALQAVGAAGSLNTIGAKKVTVKQGDPVQLVCTVSGYPEPTVQWTKKVSAYTIHQYYCYNIVIVVQYLSGRPNINSFNPHNPRAKIRTHRHFYRNLRHLGGLRRPLCRTRKKCVSNPLMRTAMPVFMSALRTIPIPPVHYQADWSPPVWHWNWTLSVSIPVFIIIINKGHVLINSIYI